MVAQIKARSSLERFRKIFSILERIADLIGGNIMRENFRIGWMNYIVVIIIIIFFSFTFYTSYVGVIVQEDWTVMLQSVSLMGTAIQGLAKFVNALANARNLRFIRSEIDGMYEKYDLKYGQYQKHLTESLLLIKRITILLLLIYGLTMIGLVCVPLYFRYILNERILILQFLIPGVDPNTSWGYTTHQIVHVICILFGLFGNFASDTLCFILVAHIPLMKNILICKFDDLDVILQQYPGDSSKSSPLLRDIFQWHQKYIILAEMSKNNFFWVIFVQIGATTSSIICTIICQFLGVMPSGPVYLVYSFVIMYIYCGLGNLVELANDEIAMDIYDSLWYLLPVREQKMVLIMLRVSHTAEGMSIGGISPLSLNAGLQITKTIYTVTMLINEFLY